MKRERHAAGCGDGLPRAVIRRRADTAKTQHHLAVVQRAAVMRDQRVGVVAQKMHRRETQPARRKRRARVGKMHILPSPAQNLVANHQQLKTLTYHNLAP